MIDKKKKLDILEEIKKSKSFSNSKLNIRLLDYLVNCELSGKTPSEYSIAQDVFNKDSSFNPNEDTIVRVSIYNLRKKLERYYNNMGRKDKVRVKIPKGRYEVQFFNYSQENIVAKLTRPINWLVLLVVLLMVWILYLYTQIPSSKNQNFTQTNNFAKEIFSGFIESKKPKLVTLGDDFIYYTNFSEFKTKSIREMVRNSNINSEEEFEKVKSYDNSLKDYKKLPFSFFNQASVWALPLLTNLFNQFDIDFTLESSSSLTSNELKSHDIFFTGSFWTLGILQQVTSNLGISYNIIGDEKLSIRLDDLGDSVLVLEREGVPAFDHHDYSVFIKVPGPNHNIIYISASFYATGTVGTLKFLTEEKSLKKLEQAFLNKFESIPEYFMIILKSKGYNREVLSTDLLDVIKVKPEKIAW